MKVLCISLFLLALSCGETKKETKPNIVAPQKTITETKKEATPIKSTIKKKKIITNNQIIAILKNPDAIKEAQEMVKNSGITWKETILDKNTSKIALIEVPEEKNKEEWLDRLKNSGYFKNVAINTEKVTKAFIEKEENTLIYIRKTSCLGDCPVYSVSIDKEGNVFYEGKQYVIEKGVKEFKLTDKQFSSLNKYLSKDFSSFKNVYDNPKIMDLPNTFISCNDKHIKIRLWNDDVPDTILELHEYLEGILLDKKFFN